MVKETASARKLWVGCANSTPIGPVWVAVSANGLVALDVEPDGARLIQFLKERYGASVSRDDSKTKEVVRQVGEYLAGERQTFDLEIDWSGMTDFQRRVLSETAAIPYGGTTTYTELARRVGKPKAARAVGRAQATNPIPLVLPCHRVLGQDGSLRGYGMGEGLKTKAWLLNFEADHRKTPA